MVFSQVSISVLLLISVVYISTDNQASAFVVSVPNQLSTSKMDLSSGNSKLNMGLFHGIAKAFSNDEYGSPPDALKATARHILVKSQDEASNVIQKLSDGSSSFTELAREYSTCPSGSTGGSWGSFGPWSCRK